MRRVITIFVLVLIMGCSAIYAQENSQLIFAGVSKTIGTDSVNQNFSLLGYTVHFPEKFDDKYAIRDISIGLGLSKGITSDEAKRLEDDMFKAIENNAELKKLNGYGPYRTTGAIYSNQDESSVIVVATMPAAIYHIVEIPDDGGKFMEENKIKSSEYMIDKIKCSWIDYSASFNESPSFTWDISEVAYMIFSIKGKFLSKDEAAAIAVKVIELNTKKNEK